MIALDDLDTEELACAGLRRGDADDWRIMPDAADRAEALASPAPPRRRRKLTLAGVARQATKAGIAVAAFEVRPDGSIGVITGKPVENAGDKTDDAATSIDPRWN